MSGNPFAVQVELMIKEFLQMLSNFYIVALMALLPLYTRGTYVLLGDGKYGLFRGLSLFCLGLAAAVVLVDWLIRAVDDLHFVDGLRSRQYGTRWKWSNLMDLWKGNNFSTVDICVLLYGASAVLSALCSSYGATAWTGYREWYMGAASQLIFVGIYFFVSRQYQGAAYPIYLWEAAFFLVTALGFCSRLGLDPLRLMQDFDPKSWEYSHLISTIGNINWFCGYCAVALAMPVAGYLKGKGPVKTIALYVVSVLGLVLLCIQGSDAGPVLAAVCLGVCLLWSRGNVTVFERTLALTAGVAFCLPGYSRLVWLRGEAALKSLPADGPGLAIFGWGGWWFIGLLCVGLYLLLGWMSGRGLVENRRKQETSGDTVSAGLKSIPARQMAVVRGLWLGMVILGGAAAVIGSVLYLSRLSDSEAWVNGRGALWRLAIQGFLRGDWKQKLLGAGPDCFAEYIYSIFSPSELISVDGHWEGSVFANAHNQWLNHLVNTGLLGVGCAFGIAAAAVRRYRRFFPGVLVLAMYGINSLVSFQQVLSTPLFFLMLGICEYSVRKEIAYAAGAAEKRKYEVGKIQNQDHN